VRAVLAGPGARQRSGEEPTAASVWPALTDDAIDDELVEWPPDLFALANVILSHTEAFRFALSPIDEWPPARFPNWAHAVGEAGCLWSAWSEHREEELPDVLTEEWRAIRERAETPLELLATGSDRRLCEAWLTLHAIADEACAGLAVALDTSSAAGCVYRARGRELLAGTGSLARLDSLVLRVLPKVCTPPGGKPVLSRYACVQRPGIHARWHKVPARHRGTDARSEYATMLLLPWPLEVRESDFHPLEGSVVRLEQEPFGFSEFAPARGLDFDLLNRVLVAAREQTGRVDVVILPASAVDEGEIDALEALLHRHGAVFLQAGVRQRSSQPGRFASNYMHIGVDPGLEKGATLPDGVGSPWFHIRPEQAPPLVARRRADLPVSPRRSPAPAHPLVGGDGGPTPGDRVHRGGRADTRLTRLRGPGPQRRHRGAHTVGRADGPGRPGDRPQLTSRWSARYASVLADDPGSAVVTLTSYGMVQRSRPQGRDASRVVALWKDPARGAREIPLESGADAIPLSVCMDRATRRSGDGRWPVANGTYAYDVAVQQIHASDASSASADSRPSTRVPHLLEAEELTVLTAWAEAVAEALAYAPERFTGFLSEARGGASWRRELVLPEPSQRLGEAIDAMERMVRRAAESATDYLAYPALLAIASEDPPYEDALDTLVRRVLLSMLEQRCTREPSILAPERRS
jgi:hypothetical protein